MLLAYVVQDEACNDNSKVVVQAAGKALGASNVHPGNPASFVDKRRGSQCYPSIS